MDRHYFFLPQPPTSRNCPPRPVGAFRSEGGRSCLNAARMLRALAGPAGRAGPLRVFHSHTASFTALRNASEAEYSHWRKAIGGGPLYVSK